MKTTKNAFLWQAVCNSERDAKVLQRDLPDGSQASQNSAEEQPLQNCQSYYGDTAPGVSHLFQSSHPHGLFPAIHLQTGSHR